MDITKEFEIIEKNVSLLKKEKYLKATKANAKKLLIFYIKHLHKNHKSYQAFWSDNKWGFWGKPDIFNDLDGRDYNYDICFMTGYGYYEFKPDDNKCYQMKITLENKDYYYDVRKYWERITKGKPILSPVGIKQEQETTNQQRLI